MKDTTTKAGTPEKVDAFMQNLEHPLHDVATALRQFILSIDKKIGEEIAWNAPSFFYTGPMEPFPAKEYRRLILNFNLFRKDCVRLVLLRGANADDPTGLLQGDYKDGRRLALFHNIDEVKKNEKALKKIIKQLLSQIQENKF
jgi:hypothetical protein